MSDVSTSSAELSPQSAIPDKLYFKIGEVSSLVGVRAHVLRYWEKEVSSIRPSKSASNQRRYRRKDVEIFREIKRLLYEERYTLAGARKRIASQSRAGEHSDLFLRRDARASADDCAPMAPSESPVGEKSPAAGDVVSKAAEPEVPLSVDLVRARKGLEELIRMASGEPFAD